MANIDANWPTALPHAVIHADLFPDNVLMLGNEVSGLIDFYFSCTDIRAYDLAVTHSAWCFDLDGRNYHADRAAALVAGYEEAFGLSEAERAAFPTLRSEEHTSELQSLMRISYAVSCLKQQ